MLTRIVQLFQESIKHTWVLRYPTIILKNSATWWLPSWLHIPAKVFKCSHYFDIYITLHCKIGLVFCNATRLLFKACDCNMSQDSIAWQTLLHGFNSVQFLLQLNSLSCLWMAASCRCLPNTLPKKLPNNFFLCLQFNAASVNLLMYFWYFPAIGGHV